MTEEIKALLDQEPDEIREQVTALEHDLDALHAHESENDEREEVIAFIEELQERRKILEEQQTAKELLTHLEEAYQTAAISEDAYQQVKERTRSLLS